MDLSTLNTRADTSGLLAQFPNYNCKHWVNSAKTLLQEGEKFRLGGDFETAYVNYVKGISVTVEVIPKLRDFDANDVAYSQLRRRMDSAIKEVEQLKQRFKDSGKINNALTRLENLPSVPSSSPQLPPRRTQSSTRTTATENVRRGSGMNATQNIMDSPNAAISNETLDAGYSGIKSIPCKQLYNVLHFLGASVLILDVRPKEDYIMGHIMWKRPKEESFLARGGVVNLEPEWIQTKEIQSSDISGYLKSFGSSSKEAVNLFNLRDKFDYIVIHDQASMSLDRGSTLVRLISAIYEFEFKQIPKNTPMLLRGGYVAWSAFIQSNANYGQQSRDWVEIGDGCGIYMVEGFKPPPRNGSSQPPSKSPNIPPNSSPINQNSPQPHASSPQTSSISVGSLSTSSTLTPNPNSPGAVNIIRSPYEFVAQKGGQIVPPQRQYIPNTSLASTAPHPAPVGLNIVQNNPNATPKLQQIGAVANSVPLYMQSSNAPDDQAYRMNSSVNLLPNSNAFGADIHSQSKLNAKPESSQLQYPKITSIPSNDIVPSKLAVYPNVQYPKVSDILQSSGTATSPGSIDLDSKLASFEAQYPDVDMMPKVAESKPVLAPPNVPPKPSYMINSSSNATPPIQPVSSNPFSQQPAFAPVLERKKSQENLAVLTAGVSKISVQNAPVPQKTEQINYPPAVYHRRSSSPSPSPKTSRFYQPLEPVRYEQPIKTNSGQPSVPPMLPPKPAKPSPTATDFSNAVQMPYVSFFQGGGTSIGMAGLKNLGNSCFMNSMIQCLSATVPLARFFLDGSYRRYINKMNHLGSKGKITEAYAQLMRSIWQSQEAIVVPSTFKSIIGDFHPSFGGNEQQDSQEFLAFLLDSLHEDLNSARTGHEPKQVKEIEQDSEGIPDEILLQQEWSKYTKKNASIIVQMFQGILKSCLECMACGKTSTTFNPFMYLTLPIPARDKKGAKGGAVLLEDCLEEFLAKEVLDGDDGWHCPRCKTKRKATKKLSIAKAPSILLIHLKRFSFEGPFRNKVETYVHFQTMNFNLTRFLMPRGNPPQRVPENVQYDLYAVSSHFGGLNGGHYTAQVKNTYQQRWFNFDDSRVGEIEEKTVRSPAAYILFYHRSGMTEPIKRPY